jgi:capsular polysaccharide transport system permease protein
MRKKRSPWQIQHDVVAALILRELKTRFGAHRLGAVWLFLEPAAHIAVMLLIFRYLRHAGPPGIDSSVFLLTGILPFLLFKNIALRVMEAVGSNRALFGYRVIKPSDTFLARALLELILYSAVFLLLAGFMAWVGIDVALYRPLAFLSVILLVSLMGLGLGMLLCVLGEASPEAKPFIRLLFLPLYFLSGVIFPISRVPAAYHDWLLWNPLLHAVELSRQAFFVNYERVADVSPRFVVETTLVLVFAGLSVYRLRRLELVAR